MIIFDVLEAQRRVLRQSFLVQQHPLTDRVNPRVRLIPDSDADAEPVGACAQAARGARLLRYLLVAAEHRGRHRAPVRAA
jgi:hypothetical protein